MASMVLRYLGFKQESSYATDPGDAEFHVDIASASLDSPEEPFIVFEGGIGRMPAQVIPGPYVPGGGVEFPVDLTSFAYIMNLLLGQNSTDGTEIDEVTDEALAAANTTLAEGPVIHDHALHPILIKDDMAVTVATSTVANDGVLVEVGESGVSAVITGQGIVITGYEAGQTIDYAYGQVGDIAAEAFGALATKTLSHHPVIMGSVIINSSEPAQVAHDNGHGKIVEDDDSGLAGYINYATGVITLTAGYEAGLTVDFSYGSYVHTITPVDGNVLPTFTCYLGKDLFEHQIFGCVLNQLDLAVEQELAKLTLDIQGAKDKKETIVALADLKLTTGQNKERPKAFHDVSLKIGDSGAAVGDISAKVRKLQLTVNNNASTEENLGLNSRFPQDGTGGALDISGSITVQFDDLGYKEDFWGGASEPSSDLPQLKALELTIDGGDWGSAVISLPNVLLKAVNIQPSGRDKQMQEISFSALYDSITGEIISAEITNLNRWHDPEA